jgi:hypothetical protein
MIKVLKRWILFATTLDSVRQDVVVHVWKRNTWVTLVWSCIIMVSHLRYLILGASGAGYQSSWGMAIKAAEILEHNLTINGVKPSL